MSNQDPFNKDKNKSDYWGTSGNASNPAGSDEFDLGKSGDLGQAGGLGQSSDFGQSGDLSQAGGLGQSSDFGQSSFDDTSKQSEGMTDKAKQAAESGKEKASEMAGMAQGRADQGIDKAAESMDKAAGMMREKGEQGGTMGSVADTAAGAMESASSFLKDTDTSQMMDQLEDYIRKNPTQSLLVAAGIGFVLSKAFG